MEFKEYLKIIKAQNKAIIASIILVVFFALVFSLARPIFYDVSLSLLIIHSGSQQTSDYKYDNYYALQASELFANTVEQWLKSPEFVASVYNKAGINLDSKNLKNLTKKFKANKLAPLYVEVRFKANAIDEAKKISETIISVLQEKSKIISTSSPDVSFSVTAPQPVISENKADIGLNLLVGFISGIVLGIFVAFGKEYFIHET